MRRIKTVESLESAPRSGADINQYLSAAASLCGNRRVQFTDLRRSVLRTLLEARTAMRAYDIVPRLEAAFGRKISAMSVYRCLEFLMAQDLVTQLKSHNAFLPRAWPGSAHFCMLYVCERCGSSIEIEKAELNPIVAPDVAGLGFVVNSHLLEMRGVCSRCAASEEGPAQDDLDGPGS